MHACTQHASNYTSGTLFWFNVLPSVNSTVFRTIGRTLKMLQWRKVEESRAERVFNDLSSYVTLRHVFAISHDWLGSPC